MPTAESVEDGPAVADEPRTRRVAKPAAQSEHGHDGGHGRERDGEELLVGLNTRPRKQLGVSRRELFERLDRPALRPLPLTPTNSPSGATPPSTSITTSPSSTTTTLSPTSSCTSASRRGSPGPPSSSFSRGGAWPRIGGSGAGGSTRPTPPTCPTPTAPTPDWTPSRLIAWAETTGPATAALVAALLATKPHPEQGYRAGLGIMRLGKRYGPARVDAACTRALHLAAPSYRTVQNILASSVDRVPAESAPAPPLPAHPNIRGSAYYTQKELALCSLTPPSTN
jgi:hypothetical protein